VTLRALARTGVALGATAGLLAVPAWPPGSNEAFAQAASGIGWSLLKPAWQYRRASELDTRPAVLGDIDAIPPKDTENMGGRVVARILINEAGRADRVLVESSEPRGVFDGSVVAAFGAARYQPGMKAGAAVKSQMRVEVRFEPLAPDQRGAARN
jgi:TonB family protein